MECIKISKDPLIDKSNNVAPYSHAVDPVVPASMAINLVVWIDCDSFLLLFSDCAKSRS